MFQQFCRYSVTHLGKLSQMFTLRKITCWHTERYHCVSSFFVPTLNSEIPYKQARRGLTDVQGYDISLNVILLVILSSECFNRGKLWSMTESLEYAIVFLSIWFIAVITAVTPRGHQDCVNVSLYPRAGQDGECQGSKVNRCLSEASWAPAEDSLWSQSHATLSKQAMTCNLGDLLHSVTIDNQLKMKYMVLVKTHKRHPQ